jgi:hypothetical protein
LSQSGSREHREQHELAQRAGGHAPGQHVLRADPQDDDHARGGEEDDDGSEHRARPRRVERRVVGALDCGGKARVGGLLIGVGLQRAHRRDDLGRVGGGVRQGILGGARASAHQAPEGDQRKDDDRDGGQDEAGKPRARHHHHGGGPEEQHDIAQRDRHRGADRGLDLRRVGGKSRYQLAGFGGVEEIRRQLRDVLEHRAAQIGDHALAQRGHEIETRRAGAREGGHDRDHHREILVDQFDPFGREAEVDHAPHRDRHRQGRQ